MSSTTARAGASARWAWVRPTSRRPGGADPTEPVADTGPLVRPGKETAA